ncbi:hypothetical protein EDB86DRAFT_2908842 [Lactarius hatsudake]|nr:hypothetical protein EDB86DRAFT_2908842 [Lactarius hatsudake]
MCANSSFSRWTSTARSFSSRSPPVCPLSRSLWSLSSRSSPLRRSGDFLQAQNTSIQRGGGQHVLRTPEEAHFLADITNNLSCMVATAGCDKAHLYPHTHTAITPTHTRRRRSHRIRTRMLFCTRRHTTKSHLHIRVGWRGTLGRVGARYWTAITSWPVGVVA